MIVRAFAAIVENFVAAYNSFYQTSRALSSVDPLTGQKGPLSGDSTVRSALMPDLNRSFPPKLIKRQKTSNHSLSLVSPRLVRERSKLTMTCSIAS
ncbi:flagellar filament capping protein FliD [Vibrio sp. M60_M31a]